MIVVVVIVIVVTVIVIVIVVSSIVVMFIIDVIIIVVVIVVSVIVSVVIGIVVIIASGMDVFWCPCGPGSSALAFPRVVARDGGRALCRGCSKSVGSLLQN